MECGRVLRILRGKLVESRAVRSPAKLEFLRVGADVSVKCQLEKILQFRTRENLSESVHWDRRQTFHTRQDGVLVRDSGGQEVF